jgi:peptidoglycan/LPS O-acetylase OafA/YrhL
LSICFSVIGSGVHARLWSAGTIEKRLGAGDFWVARVARLWPLHLVMLGFFAFFAWGEPAHDGPHFLAHLLMLQGFIAPVGRSFDDAAWSLTIELACYAIFVWPAGSADAGAVGLLAFHGARAVVVRHGGAAGWPWVADALPRGLLGFFGGMLLWRNHRHLERVPTAIWGLLAMAGFWWQVGIIVRWCLWACWSGRRC